uniref:DNA-packaging protein small subunit n=1 Tax=Siphoviridae sp. ctmxA102 TaxID=2825657 RepID=A0A8S5TW04_9CAUD|nr:MAG TPA: DNA-packaging protein small subunit [Siphoviridae sp. ctmxA102]
MRCAIVARTGRPAKEIDQKQFENLCGLQCTRDEICGWFGVTPKTLDGWCKRTYRANFSTVFQQKRGVGKISLRRHQWKLAEKNANMAIWLGKQYLDQRDEPERQTDGGVQIIDDL